MDPFSCIPIEVRQVILKQLPNLRDLQAAILASRPLYLAYDDSRKIIRQRVFRIQILCGHLPGKNDAAVFTQALRQIETLEKKNSDDGIILRELIWPLLVTTYPEGKLLEILVTWSLDYAKAYRASSCEKEARLIEAKVMQLFYFHCAPAEPGTKLCSLEGRLVVSWIRNTMISSVQHQHYEYGAVLYGQICDGWDLMCHQTLPDLLTVLLSICFNDGNSFVAKSFFGTVISKSWSLFWRSRSTSRHADDILCYDCLGGAKSLLAATKLAHVGAEETLYSIEKIWNEMSPRSPAASFWANLVVESHQLLGAGRLEGVLKVWNRLREIIPSDPTQFEIIDLDWARKVILELRNLERGKTQDRSLEFQASVLALLSRGSPVYYAFARNLADSYVQNGDTKSALTLRQQIWQELQPTSRIYTSWARELAGLYRRTGRDEEAIQLTLGLNEIREGNVNIIV